MQRIRKWGAVTLIPLLAMAALLILLHAPPAAITAQPSETTFTSLRADDFLRVSTKPVRVVTMNGTLNPFGTHQPISSTAAVATSGANITVKPSGSLLILRNVGANTITFTETGTLISAGNVALGAGDSATLVSDGTNWYQIGASNN